ncbi:MAG: hypothetical protein Kow0065_06650 [Methylomicrobium sp.]
MKNFKLPLILLGFIGLILFQREALMPMVHKVVSSDFFLVDTKDQASLDNISNAMTDLAFSYCNNHIKTELGSEYTVFFSEKPINAWSIGNYQYVINADIEIAGTNSSSVSKRYACRISYTKGDDQSGIADPSNWSVYGLSGIDEL